MLSGFLQGNEDGYQGERDGALLGKKKKELINQLNLFGMCIHVSNPLIMTPV